MIIGALEELKVTDVHALGEDKKGHVQFPLLKLVGWYLQSIGERRWPRASKGRPAAGSVEVKSEWRGGKEKVAAETWAVSVTGQEQRKVIHSSTPQILKDFFDVGHF